MIAHRVGAARNRLCSKRFLSLLLLMLLVFLAFPAEAQKRSTKKTPPPPPPPALPASIQLANGESIAVSELVPRTEAAIQQITQIASSIRNPETKQVELSLDNLRQLVNETAEETKKTIRLARSPLQLTETKVTWTRNRTQLDSINTAVVRYATGLEQQNQQLIKIDQTWIAASKSVVDAKLPEEFIQRVVGVQLLAEQALKSVRDETERLLKVQVQISEVRVQIEDVLDQLDIADTALRDQLFVIDSPPIWRVLHVSDFHGTWNQITQLLKGAGTRTSRFYHAYSARLFVYFLFNLALFAIVVRFSRQDRSTWPTDDSALVESLRYPIALTAFVMLALFSPIFSKAPSEVLRATRVLLVIAVAYLATRLFHEKFRRYVIALAAFSAVNAISVQFTSGTALRRLIILFLASAMLYGMVRPFRKDGIMRAMLEEHRWHFVFPFAYLGACFLFLSVLSNIIGNVTLADVLGNGTIFGAYNGIVAYVFCIVFTALTYAFTASEFGQRSRAIRLHRELVDNTIASYFRKLAWIFWTIAVLYAFQILTQTVNEISAILHYKLQVGAISLSLLDVVLFGLVLYVSSLIAKFIRFLLNEEILPRTSINPGAAQAGSRLTYTGLLFVGMFIAFGAAGLELSKLTVLTGAFGVGLGFGLQNVVNNFVSGIIVSLERPVQVGDFIEVGTLSGEVRTIGFRSSTVRTFDGADVIVPNSELISKSVVNWSLTDFFRRTDITIGAAYGTDPDRVLAILTRITTSHPNVLKHPEPLITFDAFGESSLSFSLRFWSKLDNRLQIRSEINTQIASEFAKEGIEIPFPQRDVHLKLNGAGGQEFPEAIIQAAKAASHD